MSAAAAGPTHNGPMAEPDPGTGAPPPRIAVSTVAPDQRYELVGDLVYRRVPGGETVVPTGRVFVRFAEGDTPQHHERELRDAGFVVAEVPGYAPHAAWLTHASGDVAAALRNLPALDRMPEIIHVEPQMIGERASRSWGRPADEGGPR
jgi:hypothetical protein